MSNAPMIEPMLALAHTELVNLQASSRKLIRHGVAASALPGLDTLLALALLGDHGRTQVQDSLGDHWCGLVERGLTHGELHDHSTPQLRLLLLVQPATEVLTDLRQRIETGATLPAPTNIFRCAGRVDKLMWGQTVRLDYHVDQVDYLLIVPSRGFRRLPVFIHTAGDAAHGNIELPADEGQVAFTMMGSDGQLYRHTTTFILRDADWQTRNAA